MLSKVLPEKKRTGTVPVYLNVYDLTPINGYAYWLGLGAYHSGVQVHGVEYAFGAHENSSSGVFEVEPKHCPGFIFRKSILIGRTDKDSEDVHNFMENISQEYAGNTYNLISRNCNHFCNDVCTRLTGNPIPGWVNRLARLGLFCNCVLPAAINEKKFKQVRLEGKAVGGEEETRKPTTSSTLCQFPAKISAQALSPNRTSGSPEKNPALSSCSKRNSKKDFCCLPTPSWLTLQSAKV
ncbi:hypothetical protein QQ045_028672 [Rhodiola kirilowii]